MAERYSLFTIIVLGESVVAATQGLQLAISDTDVNLVEFIPTIFGGLLLLFSMWWIYFFKPSHPILEENKVPVLWGYGHFFIFASGTAVGAALVVAFEHVVHPDHLSDLQVGMFIGMSVIIYLFMVWLLIWRHQIKSILLFGLTLVCALLILASLLTSYSVLCMGISTSLLVVFLELKERKGYWNNGTRRNTLE
jgi:low temperature requirement protein LtrA